MNDATALTKAEATDLARRITFDDLYCRAGPTRLPDGAWGVMVTLADGERLKVACWDDWACRGERGDHA